MKKLKMLLVDDEPQILESLSQLFDLDYDVLTATDGERGLKFFKKHPDIAIVISDQRMPGMKGAELLREIKVIAPDSMRILLTGYADLESVLESVNVGEVFRYVRKPWQPETLKSIIALAVATYMLRSQKKKDSHAAPESGLKPAKSIAEALPVLLLLPKPPPFFDPDSKFIEEQSSEHRTLPKTAEDFFKEIELEKISQIPVDEKPLLEAAPEQAPAKLPLEKIKSSSETDNDSLFTEDETPGSERRLTDNLPIHSIPPIPLPLPRRRDKDEQTTSFEEEFFSNLQQFLSEVEPVPEPEHPLETKNYLQSDAPSFEEEFFATVSPETLGQLSEYQSFEEEFFARLNQASDIVSVSKQEFSEFEKMFHGRSGKPKVLLVDDDAHVLNSLSESLRNSFDILSCNSAEAALDILESNTFVACILTDMRMPYISGSEFLFQSQALAPLVPKIMMTGYPDADVIMSLINQGLLYRHILKPWKIHLVEQALIDGVNECRRRVEAGMRYRGSVMGLELPNAHIVPTSLPIKTNSVDVEMLNTLKVLNKLANTGKK
jgi:response regulator RpfG family c-di-GMP phosphodiesterase